MVYEGRLQQRVWLGKHVKFSGKEPGIYFDNAKYLDSKKMDGARRPYSSSKRAKKTYGAEHKLQEASKSWPGTQLECMEAADALVKQNPHGEIYVPVTPEVRYTVTAEG